MDWSEIEMIVFSDGSKDCKGFLYQPGKKISEVIVQNKIGKWELS